MYSRRLRESLPPVIESIRRAAEESGRDPGAVALVAVTKGHPDAAVSAALEAGLTDLGENRVEALEERVRAFGSSGIRWHMVGRLQSRKSARAAGLAHLIHSVDSLKLGEKLARAGEGEGCRVRVLVQVNTAGEESKAGFGPEEALEALGALVELPGLEVAGLMTMAPLTGDEGVLRRAFAGLRRLHEEGRRALSGYRGTELSMGMSNDFTIAVEEGSTMVRLGTALFGERRP